MRHEIANVNEAPPVFDAHDQAKVIPADVEHGHRVSTGHENGVGVRESTTHVHGQLVLEISGLLEQARRGAARSVNAILTATYREIGRRIVEHEQGGKVRAEYGEEVLERLATDLTRQHGRGFSARNLRQMRTFYLGWEIWQTPSAKFEARVIWPAISDGGKSGLPDGIT